MKTAKEILKKIVKSPSEDDKLEIIRSYARDIIEEISKSEGYYGDLDFEKLSELKDSII